MGGVTLSHSAARRKESGDLQSPVPNFINIGPDGTFEPREPIFNENLAEFFSFLGTFDSVQKANQVLNTALLNGSRILRTVSRGVHKNSRLINLSIANIQRVQEILLRQKFSEHEMIDLHNPDIGTHLPADVTDAEGNSIETAKRSIFIRGSITPGAATHHTHLKRIGPISEFSSTLSRASAHTDRISVLSSAEATATRLREMIEYVEPGELITIIGHSLGGLVIEMAFGLLTPAEVKIIKTWRLQIITLGAPQFSRGHSMPKYLKNTFARSLFKKDFSQLRNDPKALKYFGNERLENMIQRWEENGFMGLEQVRLPATLCDRHLSIAFTNDIIIPTQAAQAKSPAMSAVIEDAEHFTNVVGPRGKGIWTEFWTLVADHRQKLGYNH